MRLTGALLATLTLLGAAPAAERIVRIGLTPVFLDDKVAFLNAWREYLSRRLGAPVEFVQRQTYREITDLIATEQLDAAWVCGFPYTRNRDRMRLLAVPVYRGEPLYESYLIVPASDTETRSVTDLRGRRFAYSDPDSNSGFLVPQVALLEAGLDPDRFFSRTFFAWSHQAVVLAVAEGLAQAGAVDGYVWDTLALHRPGLTGRTRVVTRTGKFGFPPFVVPSALPETEFRALQDAMLGMASDPAGRDLLAQLNLDGFVVGRPDLFDRIQAAGQLFLRGH